MLHNPPHLNLSCPQGQADAEPYQSMASGRMTDGTRLYHPKDGASVCRGLGIPDKEIKRLHASLAGLEGAWVTQTLGGVRPVQEPRLLSRPDVCLAAPRDQLPVSRDEQKGGCLQQRPALSHLWERTLATHSIQGMPTTYRQESTMGGMRGTLLVRM